MDRRAPEPARPGAADAGLSGDGVQRDAHDRCIEHDAIAPSSKTAVSGRSRRSLSDSASVRGSICTRLHPHEGRSLAGPLVRGSGCALAREGSHAAVERPQRGPAPRYEGEQFDAAGRTGRRGRAPWRGHGRARRPPRMGLLPGGTAQRTATGHWPHVHAGIRGVDLRRGRPQDPTRRAEYEQGRHHRLRVPWLRGRWSGRPRSLPRRIDAARLGESPRVGGSVRWS